MERRVGLDKKDDLAVRANAGVSAGELPGQARARFVWLGTRIHECLL